MTAETLGRVYIKEIFLETLGYDFEANRVTQVLLFNGIIAQSIQELCDKYKRLIKDK